MVKIVSHNVWPKKCLWLNRFGHNVVIFGSSSTYIWIFFLFDFAAITESTSKGITIFGMFHSLEIGSCNFLFPWNWFSWRLESTSFVACYCRRRRRLSLYLVFIRLNTESNRMLRWNVRTSFQLDGSNVLDNNTSHKGIMLLLFVVSKWDYINVVFALFSS